MSYKRCLGGFAGHNGDRQRVVSGPSPRRIAVSELRRFQTFPPSPLKGGSTPELPFASIDTNAGPWPRSGHSGPDSGRGVQPKSAREIDPAPAKDNRPTGWNCSAHMWSHVLSERNNQAKHTGNSNSIQVRKEPR